MPHWQSKKVCIEIGEDLGLIEIDSDAFDVLRIEAGTPVFGKEVTDKNLPQEFDRDASRDQFHQGLLPGTGNGRPDRCPRTCEPGLEADILRARNAGTGIGLTTRIPRKASGNGHIRGLFASS